MLSNKTTVNMNLFVLSLALCACLASADVSHLRSSYLPPAKPEQAVETSIEQQELRELPEQVEYMRENTYGMMEPAPSALFTPPQNMPAARYLPPQAETVPQPMEPMADLKMAPEPQQPPMEYMTPPSPPPMRYLPPQQMMQPTYQQYQEELLRMQQQQEIEQQQQPQQQEQEPLNYEMPMEMQQPLAPSDVETLGFAPEPEPAHELRSDGYYYKEASQSQPNLRH